jgi:5-methylcytosine-specific restriction enzyme subunit McrC
MRVISVFEHETIRELLSDGEKTTLDRLRGPRGKKMFEVGWHEARATSFVGVVQLGACVVQVLPKMHRLNLPATECEREATANLLFLLSYIGKLRVTEPEISRLTEKSAPLSEILYWIFARQLWDAVRRELLRGYVSVEERLNVMKGRWLVAAQAQRSDGWRRDRVDVAYDEFTEDNLPNRLFNATVLRLSRWATWSDTRSRLAQLRSAFADVADVTPRPKDFPEAAQWMQRYRRRAGDGQSYRPLLEMARMFWAGAGPQPSPGQLDAFAFMFNMNDLFEEFIAEFSRRELRAVWQAHGWSLRPQSGTRYLLCDESGSNLFKLVPDIRFETATRETALIVDTKYKRLEADDAKARVAEADAYQMFAYKERYRCQRVVLLYPQTSETIFHDFSADADSPPWLEVRTVDLQRNLMREKMRLREELTCILLQLHNMETES